MQTPLADHFKTFGGPLKNIWWATCGPLGRVLDAPALGYCIGLIPDNTDKVISCHLKLACHL